MTRQSQSRQKGLCSALALCCLGRQDAVCYTHSQTHTEKEAALFKCRQTDRGRVMLTDTAQFEEFTELFVDSPVGQLPLSELGTRTKISHVTSLLHANTC